jgi:hypothetical protein
MDERRIRRFAGEGPGALAARLGRPRYHPTLLRGLSGRIDDFDIELFDSAGHWIIEQRPAVVLPRLRVFLQYIQ